MIKIFSNALQSDSDTSDQNHDAEDNNYDHERCPSRAPAYKHLIAIHAGKPKGGLKEALKIEIDKVRRLSLSEQGLEKATINHGKDVVRYLKFLDNSSHNAYDNNFSYLFSICSICLIKLLYNLQFCFTGSPRRIS